MKKSFLIVTVLSLLFFSCGEKQSQDQEMKNVINKGISASAEQSKRMAEKLLSEDGKLPRTINQLGEFETSDSRWWTSGFFPGTLWYLYEATGDENLKNYAEIYSKRVENEQYTTDNHDVGFMIFCSFGNGYRLTNNESYKKVILQAAQSLSTRYSNSVKVIRSWDWNKKVWQYPVIIDNMMNLEMLEWASKNSDSTKFDNIARSHADITIKNHFRPDFSSYHLVDYDTITGEARLKQTVQGYSNESAWARGQGWALYGYTMMYRETKDKRYLEQAINIANYILNHPNLPEDKIPYWDFNAPNIPEALRDASAGCVMASAFIELSLYTEGELSEKCLSTAETQLKTLTSPAYLADPGTNSDFILKHSVGNLPGKSEVDVPLTYADYYFVEALVRYNNLILNKKK